MPQEVPTTEQYRGRSLRSFLEAIVAQLRRQRVIVHAGSGLVAHETPGGTELRALKSAGGVGVVWAKAPGGGIAARSTGTVTLYADITTATLSATTMTARNEWPDPIPGNKLLAIVGDAIVWSCNDAP